MQYRIQFTIPDSLPCKATFVASVLEDIRRQIIDTGELAQKVINPYRPPEKADRIGLAQPVPTAGGSDGQ